MGIVNRLAFNSLNINKLFKTFKTLNVCKYQTFKRQYSRTCLSGKTVRIGCASGFWGDTTTSVPQLIYDGNIDYLVFDYLSEITMSLLAAAKNKNPELGYAPDFVQVAMNPFMTEIKRKGIRVISNAGGINPLSCAKALKKAALNNDVDLKIYVVLGDDLTPQKNTLQTENTKDMNTGLLLPQKMHSMNAYLGAGPIAKALDLGADVVLTGRCVDSAIALGPLIHEFKWLPNEFDKLAAGSLAGHLIECGAQSTGGIFTDWQKVSGWDHMGFPIVECDSNGQFIITKPPNTGGLVNFGTVAEQLVYEIGDPQNYELPDVICDFSQVELKEIEENKVFVSNAKGKQPSSTYKVSATYSDGYRTTALCPVIGPKAALKAKLTAEAVLKRCQRIFDQLGLGSFKRVHTEILGSGQIYGKDLKNIADSEAREAVLWSAVHHEEKIAVDLFAREIAHSATGAAPGLTTLVGGRPKATPVIRLFSFLYPKSNFKIQIQNEDHTEEYSTPQYDTDSSDTPRVSNISGEIIKTGPHSYRLEDLAYTRSGDKADTANIGIIARNPQYYPYLKKSLTPQIVENYFSQLWNSESSGEKVLRYELPGIYALNFVLNSCLGGGGIASLRSDPQGKALGQMLLDIKIENMPCLSELNN